MSRVRPLKVKSRAYLLSLKPSLRSLTLARALCTAVRVELLATLFTTSRTFLMKSTNLPESKRISQPVLVFLMVPTSLNVKSLAKLMVSLSPSVVQVRAG